MHNELKSIREQMGFSIGTMAEDLGLHKATYQGYETGRRECPAHVLQSARDSLERDMAFWSSIPQSVDSHLHGGRCPNELNPFF